MSDPDGVPVSSAPTPRSRRGAPRWVAAVVAAAAAAVLAVPDATAATQPPYLSDTVPVAPGCITLGPAWSGVKVYLVQRRLGTTWERDRYGTATGAAVRRFQAAHSLPVTGRVDRATWDALGTGYAFCIDRFTVQPRVGLSAGPRLRIDAMLSWLSAQVGRRYVWGGAGWIGYDCSGLALQSLYAGGRVLPTVTTYLHQRQDFPTAAVIYASGLPKVPLAQRRRGDLVFYGPPGSITHMAVYLGGNRIIEAVRPAVRRWWVFAHSVPAKPYVVRPFPG